MSALGQKQTCALQKAMSALPPKATPNATYGDVRFGPKLLRIAVDCDLMAMRAAALELQQRTNRHGLLPSSNTKRLNDPAGSISSPDTSRSSP